MFNIPITVPDKISTLELSKIWLYKAFQELQSELDRVDPEEQSVEEEDSSS